MKLRCLFLMFFLVSCHLKGAAKAEVFATPQVKANPPQTYAILPFEMRLSPSRGALRLDNALKYPNAAAVVTDAFESAFLETGARIVERSQLDKALSEAALANSGLSENDSVALGRLVSANAVVLGAVTEYHKGGFGSKATTVSVSVKAIDVETGTILWKGQGTYTGATMGREYSIEPEAVAPQVAQALVRDLITKSK
jgi:curli biogenesis system outer membrane secretion channel CsgG